MANKILSALTKLNSIFKEHKVEYFLIGDSAREDYDYSTARTFMVGMRWDEVDGKMDAIFNDLAIEFNDVETVKHPYTFARAFKFIDGDVTFTIAAYFLMGESRYCPYRKGTIALSFPDSLLENMKKVKIGNKYVKIPTPKEDYLKATFDENNKYTVDKFNKEGITL